MQTKQKRQTNNIHTKPNQDKTKPLKIVKLVYGTTLSDSIYVTICLYSRKPKTFFQRVQQQYGSFTVVLHYSLYVKLKSKTDVPHSLAKPS